MSGVPELLISLAAFAGVTAALALPGAAGVATWPSRARGRPTSTTASSAAAGAAVYALLARLPALTAG